MARRQRALKSVPPPTCKLCSNEPAEDDVFCPAHRAAQLAELRSAEAFLNGMAAGLDEAAEQMRALARRHLSAVPRVTLMAAAAELERKARVNADAARNKGTDGE